MPRIPPRGDVPRDLPGCWGTVTLALMLIGTVALFIAGAWREGLISFGACIAVALLIWWGLRHSA
jgi:hypothetical protein